MAQQWCNTNRTYVFTLACWILGEFEGETIFFNPFLCVLCFRYKAVYNYKPQNSDELELREGDIVQVVEKCDDGWFVGKEVILK